MTAADVEPHGSKASAISPMVLAFWKLKQVTVEESLSVGKKHAALRGFLASARLLLYIMAYFLKTS